MVTAYNAPTLPSAVEYVKELLGHEDFRSLDVYAKLTILDLKEAHRKHHPRERGETDPSETRAPE